MIVSGLRTRCYIQALTETENELGAVDETWADVFDRRCRFTPKSGSEMVVSGAERSKTLFEVQMRYDSLTKTITPSHRLRIGEDFYRILSVINFEFRNREIFCECELWN